MVAVSAYGGWMQMLLLDIFNISVSYAMTLLTFIITLMWLNLLVRIPSWLSRWIDRK